VTKYPSHRSHRRHHCRGLGAVNSYASSHVIGKQQTDTLFGRSCLRRWRMATRTSRGMVPVLSVTGCTALPAPGDIGGMPPFTGVAIDGWGELFRDG
jgi:hypothetical protein